MKMIRFVNISGGNLSFRRTVHLDNENPYFIMLSHIERCISLWMCYFVSACLSSQVAGVFLQPGAGLPGCGGGAARVWKTWIKRKGTLSDTYATLLSSGTMVTSQKLPPPSDTFPFYLPLFAHFKTGCDLATVDTFGSKQLAINQTDTDTNQKMI